MKRLLLYVPAILIVITTTLRADDVITITIPASNGLYLATFPFARTNGFPVTVHSVMSTQFVGGVNPVLSDNLLKWHATNLEYITFWKTTGGEWRQMPETVTTTNTLKPGEGFWLLNRRSYPQTITFTGTPWSAFANTYTVRIKTEGLDILGFPYPVSVDMSEMGLDNVPRPGIFGDVIARYKPDDPSIYEYYFYDANNDFGGGWRSYKDPDAQEPRILDAGEGFWIYLMEASDFTWQAKQP